MPKCDCASIDPAPLEVAKVRKEQANPTLVTVRTARASAV